MMQHVISPLEIKKYLWKFVKDFNNQIAMSMWNVDFDRIVKALKDIFHSNE